MPPFRHRQIDIEIVILESRPRALQPDGRPLGSGQTVIQLLELGCEFLLLTQRFLIPSYIPKSLHHSHQLVMAELKRRRRQEQHPIKGAGQSSVAEPQVCIGILVLQLASQRSVWILEMMGFVQDEQWRSPPGDLDDLLPQISLDQFQTVASVRNPFRYTRRAAPRESASPPTYSQIHRVLHD